VPIDVHIPLTLRLDPAVVGRGIAAEVADAVDVAVGRALEEMDREVIAPRGGYAWPRYHAPAFTWGAGTATSSADWRATIEVEMTRALARTVARAPESSAERLANAPEVIPRDPAERFDVRRLGPDGYLLASYEGNLPGPEVPIPVHWFEQAPELHGTHRLTLWRFTGDPAELPTRLASYIASLPQGSVSAGQTIGVVFEALLRRPVWVIAIVSIVRAEWGDRPRVALRLLRANVLGSGPMTIDHDLGSTAVEPARDAWVSLVKLGSYADEPSLETLVRDRLLAERGISLQPSPSDTDDDAELRAAVLRYAPVFARAALYPSGHLADYRTSGSDFKCTIPAGLFDGERLMVLPVYRLEERRSEGEGASGGDRGLGERGRGEAGGAEGDAAEGGPGAGEGGAVGLRGSPLADPDAEGGAGAARFYPVGRDGQVVEIDLGPFNGEPSLDELGPLAEPLRRLMRQIAFRLEMPMGSHAGSFCIAAAQLIGIRAGNVAGMAETTARITRAAAPGTGNLGDVDMAPSHSPAIAVIRYIAATCPLLTRLQHLMVDVYNVPGVGAKITGWREGHPIGWALDFYKAYTPRLTESVGYLFTRTCQITMLELLRSSKREIDARLDRFDSYYPMVRTMILGLVAHEAELEALRRQLTAERARRGEFSAKVAESYRSWREARHALTTSLSGQLLNLAALTSSPDQTEGTIVETAEGLRIRDRHGRAWSEEELEQAIAFRRGTAASIDPLIHQFRDIPEVVQAFGQSPRLSRWYLRSLLLEMQRNNAEITAKVIADDRFAFRAGKIRADLPNRTIPYTDLSLQGIHLMTHEAIGDAFGGDRSYALGVQYVMNVELGRQGLIVFAETVSVIALAVICPPAATALGLVYARMHYAAAAEIEQLYGALIDPELILSRAEVEFDLFMAEFELVLSAIPVAGPLARGGATASKTLARSGLRAGVRSLSRRARHELMRSVGRQLETELAVRVAREVLTERGLALVLPQVLGPLMSQVHREISILSGQPVPPQAAGAQALPEHLSESEAELVGRLEEYQEGERDESLPGAEEAP
jgi:hypothetical protein